MNINFFQQFKHSEKQQKHTELLPYFYGFLPSFPMFLSEIGRKLAKKNETLPFFRCFLQQGSIICVFLSFRAPFTLTLKD